MKFIELPVDEILTLDHEVKDSKSVVICSLGDHHRLILNGQDAEFLVNVLRDQVYG